MPPTNNINETTRDLCRGLIERHIPDETKMFKPIWDAFWQMLPSHRIESLRELPAWDDGDQCVRALSALGDTSQQAMDALYVIGSVVGAVVTLLNQDPSTLIETADVDGALRHHAGQLGAPEHVRRILETFGTPLLADQLAAADWHGSESPNVPATGLLKIECSELTWNRRSCTATVTKTQTSEEVDELFRQRETEFDLFVDEPESTVCVLGTKLELSALQPRERRFLFLVLQALRRIGVVTHFQIKRDALQDTEASPESIRNAKSALNKKLSGLLSDVMTAQKYESSYAVTRLPYCWVRFDGTPSKLAPDLPA